MATLTRHDARVALESEREALERRRARNKLAVARASRRADEIQRASARSERVVARALSRLRETGVIR
jgi:hypothetical protein